jgi:4-aminobutyrate aminotransferase
VLHAPYADSFRPHRAEEGWDFLTSSYLEGVLFARIAAPEEVAAIVVEPIQGEGGYVVPPPGWLASLRELCDRYGILLVADEIQTGLGRTGRMWAVERDGVEPDILVAGKGIASGMPLGAMIAREDVATWTPGTHGSTYGGNPVACAAALATLRLVEGGLAAAAAGVGERLIAGLRQLAERAPAVQDVRGVGLMIGMELADAIEQECFRRGLLVLSAGDSAIRLSPPLVVTAAQVDRALDILGDALESL